MKVILIQPNYNLETDSQMAYTYVPYNFCILGAMIRDMCEVKIIDAYQENYTHEQLKEIITKEEADVVGITTLMDQSKRHGHKVAEIVKSIDKKITVVYGGVYVTMNPLVAIEDRNVDYFFLGEGEYTFPELIKYLKGEGPFPKKGLMYRDKKTDEVINLGKSDFIKDLDEIPPPAYDLVDFNKYSNKASRTYSVDAPRKFPYARLYTSRGCPFDCSFCQVGSISGRKFRFQSVPKVISEMKILKEKYGVKSFIFSDDNFFLHGPRAKEILNAMIENDLALPWLSEDTGVMHLNEEMIDLAAKSGCEYMGFAIETGNDRIMEDIIKGKKFSKSHAIEMAKYAVSKGIFVAANFIIGFPTETWSEIRETLDFAEELNADYTRIFNLIPLKNTPLWEICEKEDAFRDGYDHYNMKQSWNGGMVKSKLYGPNDLLALRTFEWDRINFGKKEKREKIIKRLELSPSDVDEMRQKTINDMFTRVVTPKANIKETYNLAELFSQNMNTHFENKHSISTDVSTYNRSKDSVLIKKLL